MNETVKTEVDDRQLKSGQKRLRFRLSGEAYALVAMALSLTGYDHIGVALDAVCISYLAGHPAVATLGSPADGRKRLLVRLWPDQYECVRTALDVARAYTITDADALLAICAGFLAIESRFKQTEE